MTLSVPGKAEYVSTVRLAVSSLAAKSGFDVEAIEDIKVAVSEACSNILCHSDIGNEYIYRVECTLHGDRLEIIVVDDGVGFDANDYEEPDPECLQVGGLGLYIIKALMDEVNVESQDGTGTRIRMIKNIGAVAAAAAAGPSGAAGGLGQLSQPR
jgi:serine/threonine-protein kinase RsbW